MFTEADILAYHARRLSGLASQPSPRTSSSSLPSSRARAGKPRPTPSASLEKPTRSFLMASSAPESAHPNKHPGPSKRKARRAEGSSNGEGRARPHAHMVPAVPSSTLDFDAHRVKPSTPSAATSVAPSGLGPARNTRSTKRQRRSHSSPSPPSPSLSLSQPQSLSATSTPPAQAVVTEAELLRFHAFMCHSERLFAEVDAGGRDDSRSASGTQVDELQPETDSEDDWVVGPLAFPTSLEQAQQAADSSQYFPRSMQHLDPAQRSITTSLSPAPQSQSPWPTQLSTPVLAPASPTAACQALDLQETLDQDQVESYLCLTPASPPRRSSLSTDDEIPDRASPYCRPPRHIPLQDRHRQHDEVTRDMVQVHSRAPSTAEGSPARLPTRHSPRSAVKNAKRSVPLVQHLGRHPRVTSQERSWPDLDPPDLPPLPPAPAPRHFSPTLWDSQRGLDDQHGQPPSKYQSADTADMRDTEVGSERECGGTVKNVAPRYGGTHRVAAHGNHINAISASVAGAAATPSTPAVSSRRRYVLSPSPPSVASVASVPSSPISSVVLPPSSPGSHFSFLVPSSPVTGNRLRNPLAVLDGVHGHRYESDERRNREPPPADRHGGPPSRPGLAPGWVVWSSPQ